MNQYNDNTIDATEKSIEPTQNIARIFQRRALTFMAFINVGQYLWQHHIFPQKIVLSLLFFHFYTHLILVLFVSTEQRWLLHWDC